MDSELEDDCDVLSELLEDETETDSLSELDELETDVLSELEDDTDVDSELELLYPPQLSPILT